jgi:hypothetical protein
MLHIYIFNRCTNCGSYKQPYLLTPDVDVGFSATESRTHNISFLKGKQQCRSAGTAVCLFPLQMLSLVTLFHVE